MAHIGLILPNDDWGRSREARGSFPLPGNGHLATQTFSHLSDQRSLPTAESQRNYLNSHYVDHRWRRNDKHWILLPWLLA